MNVGERKAALRKNMLRIGIIGMGGRGLVCFGSELTRREDVCIAAIADPNRIRMERAAGILGITPNSYTSIPEMLDKEALDGVIITSPDYTHEENVLLAIERGIDVLVDKPLATTSAGCIKVIQAAQKAGVNVSVGFNLRYVPVLRKVKELIDEGRIGDLMLIENREFYGGGRTYMSRWNRMREFSGGLWIHKGSHDFDIFNWWNSKGKPIRVATYAGVNAMRPDKIPFKVEAGKPVGPRCRDCAYKSTCPDFAVRTPEIFDAETSMIDGYMTDLCMYTSDKDTHDNGISIVEYDNNVRASHMECFICGIDDRRYTVVGDRGMITASLSQPSVVQLQSRWGKRIEMVEVPVAEGDHGGSDPIMIGEFVRGIQSGSATLAGALDGLASVAIGEAAEESWRGHRMVEIEGLSWQKL
jgi:predicted dehydrogenase